MDIGVDSHRTKCCVMWVCTIRISWWVTDYMCIYVCVYRAATVGDVVNSYAYIYIVESNYCSLPILLMCSQLCLKMHWWVLGQNLPISYGWNGSGEHLLWQSFCRLCNFYLTLCFRLFFYFEGKPQQLV